MADIQGLLTRKVGPLPVWAYAAMGGALIGVVVLYKRGAAGATAQPAPGTQSGQNPWQTSPIIVAPGNMPTDTSSMNPSPPSTPAGPLVTAQSVWKNGGAVWVFGSPADTSFIGSVPDRSTWPSGGPPVNGGAHTANGQTSSSWQPIKWAGTTAYLWGPEALPASSGMGGGSSVVTTMPGAGDPGRFNGPHAHSQYVATGAAPVNGMGGGGGALQRISDRTGLPLIRLMALNPGHWRPGSGMGANVVHIN